MMLKPEKVAKEIVYAINHQQHIRVIDWRYRILTAIWRRIPRFLWRRLKLSGEETVDGKDPVRISFFTTFMPLVEMSDTQREAIFEELMKDIAELGSN